MSHLVLQAHINDVFWFLSGDKTSGEAIQKESIGNR